VYEAEQGLTPARVRGVRETRRPWIAFVDDDNLLAPDWLAAMSAAIHAHPWAGGVGGRVRLVWDVPPLPAAAAFGFCFAEQELGEAPLAVGSLVGAGMVLRRAALEACGWTKQPLLADRIGRSLISGGDAEIALRVRSAGFELWYEPAAVMDHRMPAGRATRGYLMRINRALGATSVLVGLLAWPGDYDAWGAEQRSAEAFRLLQALRGLWWSLTHRREVTAAFGWLSYALGMRSGLRAVAALSDAERAAILGKAAPPAKRTYAEALSA
jgi:glycosyltransferase involved in cell wall biosynthesis